MTVTTTGALRFPQISLDVQVNRIQGAIGQTLSDNHHLKPKANYTGERLLRERPRVYRRVVELLAEPGMSINQITKLCRVSEHTVRAVRDREAIPIAERKQTLVSIFANTAQIAAERMEELAGRASLRDAGTTAGIATDKLLALLGESGGIPVHLNLQVTGELLHERYAQLVREISGTQSAESSEALPNGEAFSVAGAMGLQSEEENLQK